METNQDLNSFPRTNQKNYNNFKTKNKEYIDKFHRLKYFYSNLSFNNSLK